jgi:Leucine-rich repeat (LRR) protein
MMCQGDVNIDRCNLMLRRWLNFHSNQIRSIASLPPLPALTHLNLSSNMLSDFALRADPPVLPSLVTLDLSSNQIRTLEGFPPMPCLQRLLLPFNCVGDLKGLPALPSLRYLDLRDNLLEDYLPGDLAALAPQLSELLLQVRPTMHPALPL